MQELNLERVPSGPEPSREQVRPEAVAQHARDHHALHRDQ